MSETVAVPVEELRLILDLAETGSNPRVAEPTALMGGRARTKAARRVMEKWDRQIEPLEAGEVL